MRDTTHRDTFARSLAKAVSWRLMGTVATSALVFLFTRRLVISLAVGGLEFASKIALFYVHERMWNRITFGRADTMPAVVWLTGLSGAGKSTIAAELCSRLRGRGLPVEHLDGDTVRDFFPGTGFSKAERDEHVRRVGHLASRLEQHGVFVVASLISPYAEARQFVRGRCRNFIEVYVATPLEECERRDVKGLYARARRGELRRLTGVDDPYEAPDEPELRIDTQMLSPAAAADLVWRRIKQGPERRPHGSPRPAREHEYSHTA
jgi:adenylylsulfate kinase